MDEIDGWQRRRFLQASAITTAAILTGCLGDDDGTSETITQTPTPPPTPTPTPRPPDIEIGSDDIASAVSSWAAFPTDNELWRRWDDPYTLTQGDRRWQADPTEDGIRLLVDSDESPGNAGFYLYLGQLGDLNQVEFGIETLQSASHGEQHVLLALYMDVNGDGEFFEWDVLDDGGEHFVGFGDDLEAVTLTRADDRVAVDIDTEFELNPSPTDEFVTLADLKYGEVDGINGLTDVALQFSVVGSGSDTVEELLINDISIWSHDPISEGDWPMYANNQLNNGRSTVTLPIVDEMEPVWTFETGGSVHSSPAIVDGRVFFGSDDGRVYAVDEASSEQLWAYETGGKVRSSPAIFSTILAVGSDDGTIYALSTGTGTEIWTYDTDGPIRSSPTVERGSRYYGVDDAVGIGSDDNNLYVLEGRTGEAIRRINTAGFVRAAPLILETANFDWEIGSGALDSRVYYWVPTFQDGIEHSLEAEAPVYAPLSKPHMGRPPDIWYRANDAGTLSKFDSSDDSVFPANWTYEADDAIRTAPVIGGQFVYVISQNGTIHAVKTDSGEAEWTLELGSPVGGSPAVTDDTIVAAGGDTVYGLDPETGVQHWNYEASGEINTGTVVANGRVYFGTEDGYVYGLHPS